MLKSLCAVDQLLSYAVRCREKHIFGLLQRSTICKIQSQKLYVVVLATGLVTGKALRIGLCQVREQDNPWLLASSHTAKMPQDKNQSILIRVLHYLYSLVLWPISVTIRMVTLLFFFTPVAVTFPIAYFCNGFEEYWWRVTLYILQRSGPTFIKLGQWASTRRDIFSKEFCDRMSVLHTKTTFRQWSLSQHALDQLFGDSRWKNFITSVKADPIGSGCIAQVYRAVLDVYAYEDIMGTQIPFANERYLDIAIKVAKEGVREKIAIDLSILQSAFYLLQLVLPGLSYVDPVSCLNQFREVLELQVDLRNEARALKRFGDNFDPEKTGVRFPRLLCYSSDVIIETHEEGLYVNKLITDEHLVEETTTKKKIALIGARALLKMIFVDNFVHADLHPGNILAEFFLESFRLNDRQPTTWSSSLRSKISSLKTILTNLLVMNDDIRFTSKEECSEAEEPSLVILDTGIAIEETPQNLQKLRLLFRAVIDKRGRDVGELLLIHSPKSHCKDPKRFCDEVDRIVQKARSKNNLRKLNISEMLNELFSIVRRYEVSLDPSFTTVVLAVMVLEGLGRSLDPDLDLFHCARPFIFSMV